MVPVELKLKNFLSYGTEAPPLDFEQFQVACLSGRNGQGKSALLDAVTWALWGEARKSSGSRKPDADLLRIGAREMQVELVFDVEGERYRVVRSYYESQTGKTSRPGLEVSVRDASAGSWRPLTGGNMRETQEIITGVVGIDYDTFINSAFLLQGRSDEFTKKKPSQRKEILTRILDLGRYKKLARGARRCWREAKECVRRAEAEIERLEEVLEDAPAWECAREQVSQKIEQKQEQLEELRAEESALTERLADLEAKEREAASLEETRERLGERIEDHREEAVDLRARIEEADALIGSAEEIERAFDHYERLLKERDALDEKRDLHRGVEKQIEQRRSDLKDRKNELEKRLHRLEVEQKSDRQQLEQCEAALSKQPALRQALKAAREAKEQRDELVDVRARRRAVQETQQAAREELAGRREALKARLEALEEQASETAQRLAATEGLEAQARQLETASEELHTLKERREDIRETGQAVGQTIKVLEGTLAERREELAEQEEQLAHLQSASDGGRCPTCGTELTAAHRQEVASQFQERIATLADQVNESEQTLEKKQARRKELRVTYTDVQEEIDKRIEVPEKLAAVRRQLDERAEQQEALEKQRASVEELERTLEENHFSQEARERLKTCREELAELDFDEEAFERIQQKVARAEDYEERLQELEEQAGRQEQIEKRLEARSAQIDDFRTTLEDGSAFGDLQEQIRRLEAQREDVGFDAERFQSVKGQLGDLSDAGSRMRDLSNARKNRADWEERIERTEERIQAEKEERAEVTARLEALEEALDGKATVEEEQQDNADACAAVESDISEKQQRLGELNRRLEEAERDRAALDARRQEQEEAKAERHLYKQLKQAFGKHGIPSLIIEQTLPEIEERANRLLERLTEGRMHVRLETLKEKKTGGTKETLEIIITDEQGAARAYETFSGGEAFRVNFALRIALAQLLAERSGVRIRTLVIDEGFGTQDAEGLQHLIDAIRVIQTDFDKILVITHLQELKAKFPVRIEVEKDPLVGSSFELMGA